MYNVYNSLPLSVNVQWLFTKETRTHSSRVQYQ